MRGSVHIDLPGWTKLGPKVLAARCEELHLQPRGTRGESGGQTGITYDISNKHRLGYTEVKIPVMGSVSLNPHLSYHRSSSFRR